MGCARGRGEMRISVLGEWAVKAGRREVRNWLWEEGAAVSGWLCWEGVEGRGGEVAFLRRDGGGGVRRLSEGERRMGCVMDAVRQHWWDSLHALGTARPVTVVEVEAFALEDEGADAVLPGLGQSVRD